MGDKVDGMEYYKTDKMTNKTTTFKISTYGLSVFVEDKDVHLELCELDLMMKIAKENIEGMKS